MTLTPPEPPRPTAPQARPVPSAPAWIAPALALAVTAGFFAVLVLLLLRPEPAGEVATTLLGALGAGWVGVISYYFGSSSGSQIKTRLLAERSAADQDTAR